MIATDESRDADEPVEAPAEPAEAHDEHDPNQRRFGAWLRLINDK